MRKKLPKLRQRLSFIVRQRLSFIVER